MRFVKFLPLIVALALVLVFAYKFYEHSNVVDESSKLQQIGMSISTSEVANLLNNQEVIAIIPKDSELPKVLHVFTTWCSCCKKEIPEIVEISKTQPIIGLAWTDKPQEAVLWLNENGNPYSNVGVIGHQESADLGISKAPVTLVIGRDGRVLYSHQGKLSKKDFDEIILPYIKR